MRTLLFVQAGQAKPSCIGRCTRNDMGGLPSMHNLLGGLPGAWGNNRLMKAQRMADRWWLVECESATHGRILIDRTREYTDMGIPRSMPLVGPPGRVLASGGRP